MPFLSSISFPGRGPCSSGFTVLEIVISLSAMGIAAAAAVPSWRMADMKDVGREAALMSARVSHARSQAVLHGASMLEFTSSSVSSFVGMPGGMAPGGAIPGDPATVMFRDFTVDPAGPLALTFDSYGRLCGGALSPLDPARTRFRCSSYAEDVEITLKKGGASATVRIAGGADATI